MEFNNFIEKFETLLSKIENERPYCTLITGDFNAHCNEWYNKNKTNIFGSTLQGLFNDHGLFQMVHHPTFITKVARTSLDLVITNQPNLILSTEVHPSLHTNSHHQVNYTKVHLKCPPPPPYERRLWHYGRANIEAIQKSISGYDWENALGLLNHDPDLQVDHLDEVFLNVAKNFIPFEEKKIYPKDPPWITQPLKTLYINYKRKYKRICKKKLPPR